MMCQNDHWLKHAIKLLRLHNETVEALSRYRRKGERRVVVQHVTIEGGGQAIVGGMFIPRECEGNVQKAGRNSMT